MSKQMKPNGISDYANLKLFDLEVLNEINRHIKEVCSLRKDGIAVGIGVDEMLQKLKSDYRNLLDRASKLP
jgi:hypothetical protein